MNFEFLTCCFTGEEEVGACGCSCKKGDLKAQIFSTSTSIVLGIIADLLIELECNMDNWFVDAVVTSLVTMAIAFVLDCIILSIRRTCRPANAENISKRDYFIALLGAELAGFTIGFTLGIAVGAFVDKVLKSQLADSFLTPLTVSPTRVLLKSLGFHAVKSCLFSKGNTPSRKMSHIEDVPFDGGETQELNVLAYKK